MKKKGTQNGTKIFTIVIFLVVIVALGYYTHLSNKAPSHQDVSQSSEKEKLLNYDMENEYPKTARDVVKLHCRYLKYVYSTEFTKEAEEDDYFGMNQQIRRLFDEELLALNTADNQLDGLKSEIALYQANKQKFISYTLAEASQIEYNTEDGMEYAKMKVTVAMTIDGASLSVDEEYILRKDAEGRWKILGWQAMNHEKAVEEGDAK